MKRVCCVYEENHGMIGVAKDFSSAIDGLIEQDWLDGNGNPSTVKEVFGGEWINLIKHWDKDTFNINFDGILYINTMEIWGS